MGSMRRSPNLIPAIRISILLALVTAGPESRAAETPAVPNFIVIVLDDAGWNDIGAYGNPAVRTPSIDRLAREGMRFDSAFVTTSSCSPSRASLMTGRYPHNTGAQDLDSPLPASAVIFLKVPTSWQLFGNLDLRGIAMTSLLFSVPPW